MRWVDDELVLAIGYYRLYGVNLKDKEFQRHVDVFKAIQLREPKSAFNTLKMKLFNIKAYEEGNENNDGGLLDNDYFIDMYTNYATMDRYRELMRTTQTDSVDYTKEFKLAPVVHIDEFDIRKLKKAEVEYTGVTLEKYLSDIKEKYFKVPLFQREFVWTGTQVVAFLNSMIMGYPFGTVTAWVESNNALDERNVIIQNFADGRNVVSDQTGWIIDGQQRTTSIVATLSMKKDIKQTKEIIFSFDSFSFKKRKPEDTNYIYACHFLNNKMNADDLKLEYSLSSDVAVKLVAARADFMKRQVGITKIKGADINTAIDIFTEMNTKGKKLSIFDILNAKWMSDEIQINLESEYTEWLKANRINPKHLQAEVFIKSIYLMIDKTAIAGTKITKFALEKKHANTDKMIVYKKSLTLAWEFLLNQMYFKPELMPSSNIIKFLSYAYYANNNETFNASTSMKMKKYIKLVCLNNFYSSSTDSRIADNIKDVDSILSNINFDVESVSRFVIKEMTPERLKDIRYSDNSSSYYFILNLLFKYAKGFKNNENIPVFSNVDGNSDINIHHIIPKSLEFEGKKINTSNYCDSIVNLTPILEEENKIISNKFPAEYYLSFKKENRQLDFTLEDARINPTYLEAIDKSASIDMCEQFWKDRETQLIELINE